jgi:hypothetical protein
MAFSIVNFGNFKTIQQPRHKVRILDPTLKDCPLVLAYGFPNNEIKVRLAFGDDYEYRSAVERLVFEKRSFMVMIQSPKNDEFVFATMKFSDVDEIPMCSWEDQDTFFEATLQTECVHDFMTRRCMACGTLSPDIEKPSELTLQDWLGSKKIQRRLSAGTWGSDHPKRMNFPTDSDSYEPADRPIIPMPDCWYEPEKS